RDYGMLITDRFPRSHEQMLPTLPTLREFSSAQGHYHCNRSAVHFILLFLIQKGAFYDLSELR
ncbi:MAG: hypothetical protein MJ085_02130, partial [Clostridia bacterium]|nr:hypothetical protein [Clostridia bacterium]